MRSRFPSSLIYFSFLLFKFKATVRADVGVGRHILVTVGARKDKLCPTIRANRVLRAERGAAVRAKIRAAGRTHFIVLTDRFAAIAAERGPLDLGLCLFEGFLFILKTGIQFGTTMRTDCGVGWHFLVADRTIKAELSPALGADGIVRAHRCAALGAVHNFLVVLVELCV
jgi:hypothetical protein